MTTKLYKICYKPEQLTTNDGFEIWNNLENKNPELCEFPIFENIYDAMIDYNVDYWGAVSPKFSQKTNISSYDFLDWIRADQGKHNVYFINPVPIVESLFPSTVHHGENCHHGMLGLLQRNISHITNLKLDTLYMDYNTFSLCNYFVGDKIFWNKYMKFVHSFLESVDKNTNDKELLYGTSANYGPNKTLPFYTFVIERLFSIFLNIYKSEITVSHYPYSREALLIKTGLSESIVNELQALSDIKQVAISDGHSAMMQHWAFFRNRMAQQNSYLFLME